MSNPNVPKIRFFIGHSPEVTAKKIKQVLWEWRGVFITAPTVALLTIALRSLGVLQLLEWATLDLFFRWRPIEPTDSRIVIVAISESDIQRTQTWPISDQVLAQLLETIKSQQPAAIGLDIYRDLPVEPGHDRLLEVFASTPNLIGIQKVTGDAYGDSVEPPAQLSELGQVGAADILLDQDGKVRRILLSVKDRDDKTVYSFAVKLALEYLKPQGIGFKMLDRERYKLGLGKTSFVRLTENDGGYVGVDSGGIQILFNPRNHLCRNRLEQCHVFDTVSMNSVLENRIPPDFFRDRLVLIGSTAASLKDRFFTAYSNSYFTAPSGVEIHADAVTQLLSGALEGRRSIAVWSDPVEGFWIFLWSGVGAILGWRFLRIRSKIMLLALVGGGSIGGGFLVFLAGWWIPVVPPLLALMGSAVAMIAYTAYIESENRQTVMNLLGQHVSPKIAQAVWNSRHELLKEGQILGQQMTATVLFTDLQGFTRITEQSDAQTLMLWLNEYMKAMSGIVLDHDGVVDKFIGDAIMAVFGVPIPRTRPDEIAGDAIAAVACAVAMGKKLRSLNQQWQAQGRPTVAMRVGISTGHVFAGSLGSRQRLNYTVLGDTVNIAARLESYDKTLDGGICRILIGEETYHYIQGQFPTQCIGSVQLKGREQRVNIYQVLM
ncbi:CHASE2 domain-containing protein [Laspinema olomoucense]|uniref:Adenylate/guanylate cyclase domain-containing protein n=1 Tax=Laspinema olomoucense D3b TaxID=2953688 RepID=A0ABT2NBF6_9CYAN|nr:adenylate/guanylate cyclase domain-containing protein [Laspinema sp. D3b]MCT7979050.1 adenylate/guanylate cyclase domain-containing protein [Laspinema sp. D3b]